MTVKFEKLLRMAEQIAANISISDDPQVVADQVAGHLQRFWDPRMRAQFMDKGPEHAADMSPVLKKVLAQMCAADQRNA